MRKFLLQLYDYIRDQSFYPLIAGALIGVFLQLISIFIINTVLFTNQNVSSNSTLDVLGYLFYLSNTTNVVGALILSAFFGSLTVSAFQVVGFFIIKLVDHFSDRRKTPSKYSLTIVGRINLNVRSTLLLQSMVLIFASILIYIANYSRINTASVFVFILGCVRLLDVLFTFIEFERKIYGLSALDVKEIGACILNQKLKGGDGGNSGPRHVYLDDEQEVIQYGHDLISSQKILYPPRYEVLFPLFFGIFTAIEIYMKRYVKSYMMISDFNDAIEKIDKVMTVARFTREQRNIVWRPIVARLSKAATFESPPPKPSELQDIAKVELDDIRETNNS